jgi:dihydroneopterin aldolase
VKTWQCETAACFRYQVFHFFQTDFMLTIELTGLRFFAYHGLYEEEQRLGADFEMDVVVGYRVHRVPPRSITETLDYVSLYQLVQQQMALREDLLETIVCNTALAILHQFAVVEEVDVVLKKLQPPIADFRGTVAVRYHTKRTDLPSPR